MPEFRLKGTKLCRVKFDALIEASNYDEAEKKLKENQVPPNMIEHEIIDDVDFSIEKSCLHLPVEKLEEVKTLIEAGKHQEARNLILGE